MRRDKGTDRHAATRRKQDCLISSTLLLFLAGVLVISVIAVRGAQSHRNDTQPQTSATSSNGTSAGADGTSIQPPQVSNGTANPEVTGAPVASPITNSSNTTKASQFSMIGYWGATALTNTQPLAYFCDLGMYSTINLGYMNEFGGSSDHFGIAFGNNAVYRYDPTAAGPESKGFDLIARDIAHCQRKGVKIMLSIGGPGGNYTLEDGDGKSMAELLYSSFFQKSASSNVLKPFGADTVLDGIDISFMNPDSMGATWTQETIDLLVTLKSLSPATILSVAVPCSSTWPVVTSSSANVPVDYVNVLLYKDDTCLFERGFNFIEWTHRFEGKIILGLALTEDEAVPGGFVAPVDLPRLVTSVSMEPQFAGVSLLDVEEGGNYANTVRSLLG
ncbi:glycoside hydrolase superfamily [Chytriomyces cf. hyalinus JEL632]|nr:glycoside hydrolase superfamily [Chytriomyces cf. hyalinus JEL632]